MLSIYTWTFQMMSLVSVVPFSYCAYSGYIVIISNYNTYVNLIGVEVYNAPESSSLLKLLLLTFISKQNSAALFFQIASYCIQDAQMLSMMTTPITSFLTYQGSFCKCAPYQLICSTSHMSNPCLYHCQFLLLKSMAFARHPDQWE